MRLRAVYESARLAMLVRGFRPASLAVGNGFVVPELTFLDGRHLYRPDDPERSVPTAVFVHGLGSSVATWSSVLPVVARNVPVVAPDLPGYGRTALPDGASHASFREMVDATIAFVDTLSPRRPVQLIGQSMGGWIAARVAAEIPDRIARLTLVNSAGILHPQVFEQRRLFTPGDREALRRLWRSMWRRLPITYYLLEDEYLKVTRTPVVRGFLESIEEDDFLNGHLDLVTAPTLLVWGLADRLISYESVRTFREGLADIRIREIPGCGHVPQRECTRSFLRYLQPWLRGDEPPEEELPGLQAVRRQSTQGDRVA